MMPLSTKSKIQKNQHLCCIKRYWSDSHLRWIWPNKTGSKQFYLCSSVTNHIPNRAHTEEIRKWVLGIKVGIKILLTGSSVEVWRLHHTKHRRCPWPWAPLQGAPNDSSHTPELGTGGPPIRICHTPLSAANMTNITIIRYDCLCQQAVLLTIIYNKTHS